MNLIDPDGRLVASANPSWSDFAPSNDPWDPDFWPLGIYVSIFEGGGGGYIPVPEDKPTPCQVTANSLLTYMQSTPAFVDGKNLGADSRKFATVADAKAIMKDAVDANIDPRLLVAISFVESKWGGTKGSQDPQNAFGILNNDGTLKDFSATGGWSSGIDMAVDTVAAHTSAGQDTIAKLYSGKKGAYCVGPGCNGDVVEYQFKKQGGNLSDLSSPCYREGDKYFQKSP